jgi:hypothetical protein
MRLPSLSHLLVVLVLVSGGAAVAQRRQLNQFQGEEMTQEQRDAARSRPKYNINDYGRDIKVKEEPFPWMALGLAGIVFAVISPFAYRAYKSTTKDIADANTFGATGSREDEGEQQ